MSDPATGGSLAERRSRRSVAVVIVALALALLLCCAGVIGAIFVARDAMDTALDSYTSGSEWVAWSGDGRFAVIQSLSQDGTPLLAVWDSSTGSTRVETGYRAVVVEPHGARLWLTAATSAEAAGHAVPDPASIVADPDELMVWSLADEGSVPATPATLEWDPWPGPAGVAVLAASSASGGAFPTLRVEDSRTGSVTTVELPEGSGPVELLGWSPSGRYFAVLGRPREDLPVFVSIIDGADGAVVSVDTPVVARPGLAGATWSPVADMLLLSVPAELAVASPEASPGRVMTLHPDGTFVEAAAGQALGSGFAGEGVGLTVVGVSEEGLLFAEEGVVWVLGEEGPRQIGELPSAHSLAYHPRGGLVVLDEEWSDRDATIRTVVAHSDVPGGSLTTIWEGPERSVAFGLKGR